MQKIDQILAFNSSINIFVNYENKPQEAALALLTKHSQIEAFNTTINRSNQLTGYAVGPVHWIPPWSDNYDPIVQTTWDFIIAELEKM